MAMLLGVVLALVAANVATVYWFARTVARVQRSAERRESLVTAQIMDAFTRREDQLVAQIAGLAGRSWAPPSVWEVEPELEPENGRVVLTASPETLG